MFFPNKITFRYPSYRGMQLLEKKRLAMIRSTRNLLSNKKFIGQMRENDQRAKFLVFQRESTTRKYEFGRKKQKKEIKKRYLHLHSRISFTNSVGSQRCSCNKKKNKRELIPRETSKLELRFHFSLSFISLSLSGKKRKNNADHSRSEKFQRTPTRGVTKLLP